MKKIKTESGIWIPATYKTGKYKQWKDRSKADEQEDDDGDEGGSQPNTAQIKGNIYFASFKDYRLILFCCRMAS